MAASTAEAAPFSDQYLRTGAGQTHLNCCNPLKINMRIYLNRSQRRKQRFSFSILRYLYSLFKSREISQCNLPQFGAIHLGHPKAEWSVGPIICSHLTYLSLRLKPFSCCRVFQEWPELPGIIMEINDLRKKGRKSKEQTCREIKIVGFNLHRRNEAS